MRSYDSGSGVRIEKLVKRMVFCHVCSSKNAVRVHGDPRGSRGVAHEGVEEKRFTRWGCHLSIICGFGCLNLIWDGSGVGRERVLTWLLRVCGGKA